MLNYTIDEELEELKKELDSYRPLPQETAQFMLDIAKQTSEDKLGLEDQKSTNSIRRKTHRR